MLQTKRDVFPCHFRTCILPNLTGCLLLLKRLSVPSRKQTAETLLSLAPAEVANLKEGINFFRNKTTGKEYILYKEKDHLKACKNLCKHQGGLFMKDIEDLDGRYHGSFAPLPVTLFAVRVDRKDAHLDILNDPFSKLLPENFPLVSLGQFPDFNIMFFLGFLSLLSF